MSSHSTINTILDGQAPRLEAGMIALGQLLADGQWHTDRECRDTIEATGLSPVTARKILGDLQLTGLLGRKGIRGRRKPNDLYWCRPWEGIWGPLTQRRQP